MHVQTQNVFAKFCDCLDPFYYLIWCTWIHRTTHKYSVLQKDEKELAIRGHRNEQENSLFAELAGLYKFKKST